MRPEIASATRRVWIRRPIKKSENVTGIQTIIGFTTQIGGNRKSSKFYYNNQYHFAPHEEVRMIFYVVEYSLSEERISIA